MAPRIIDTIKKNHREIESYYGKLITSQNEDEQTRFQNLFTWELARHSIGEELIVYPLFEKLLSEGVAMANKDRDQHLKVKKQLKAFQKMTPSDAQFVPTVRELMENLTEHIKEEENDDLPKLEQALTQEDSEEYSKSFGRTKMFVPSRAHPSAPDKPPYETVVGLLTAPIDHLADLFHTLECWALGLVGTDLLSTPRYLLPSVDFCLSLSRSQPQVACVVGKIASAELSWELIIQVRPH
ncbi:hemerythrin/HHE cation-binding motif [Penicillium digitatum]|uniref:Hemerythrin/HHE cation-binding motif n=1 Tax=Penicillium digitatum TaxID=36651 RepID=A0A7T6XIC1_PENDI|nr:hemerythrin/HHE cation-binding motif [Penicillium digitatum]